MPEPTKPDAAEQATDDRVDDEISLLDLAIVLAKHKKLVLGLPAAAAVIAAVVSLLLPNYYTGTTKILPPQQTQSTSAVLAQLGSLAGLAGGAVSAGLKNPNDLYVGMLKSRTVADNLIRRFDLNKYYGKKYESDTRKRLTKETTIVAGKDGIIGIEVDDHDPKRAADLANAYVDELFKLTTVLAVTEASQRRLFFERQLDLARVNLVKAETEARKALEQGGLAAVDAQGRTAVETAARLRAQITVKEVQIGAMRTFAAEANPELKRAQQEIEVMKRELAKSEGAGPSRTARTAAEGSSGIDNLGLLRDVKYYETMYGLLAQQYESAKIDEAKDSAIIQVMDKAIEPDRKAGPSYGLIISISAVGALLLAIICAFIIEALERSRGNPRGAEQLRAFRHYLARR
jgi:uncharacterized protein involved in exopolysaccharide biosynthesis